MKMNETWTSSGNGQEYCELNGERYFVFLACGGFIAGMFRKGWFGYDGKFQDHASSKMVRLFSTVDEAKEFCFNHVGGGK
jgi:hypothetical protein